MLINLKAFKISVLFMKKYDVVVIGGGPSGAISAWRLAEKKVNVVLLEKGSRLRVKPCAGGISNGCYNLLKVPDELVERKIVKGLVVSRSNKSVYVGSAKEPGFIVYRPAYDKWLMDSAEKAGADVINNAKATKIKIFEDKVEVTAEVEGKEEKYEAEVLIGAYGMESNLSKQLGIETPKYINVIQYELELPEEIIDERIGDAIEVYFNQAYSQLAYVWMFPRRDVVEVGLHFYAGTNARMMIERLDKFIKEHPIASEKLKGAKIRLVEGKKLVADTIPTEPLKKTYGHRFVVVGDAAGLVDPYSYEGIFYALRSGIIASEVIAKALEENDLSETSLKRYQDRWMKEIYEEEIKYAMKLHKMSYGHDLSDDLVDALVEAAIEDRELRRIMGWLLNHKYSRKYAYNALKAKQSLIIKKLGLIKSLKLLFKTL